MKPIIKKLISNSSSGYNWLSYLYHIRNKYWQPRHYHSLNRLLSLYNSFNSNIHFIQVGSNDGISNDPLNYFINKHAWKGVCIEPIPGNFLQLGNTYFNNPNVELVNAAIGNGGVLTLY